MNREQRILVVSMVGLFGVLAGVLAWSYFQQARHYVLPGQEFPQKEEEKHLSLPPLRPNDPVRGSADPQAVPIVLFADYHCPFCRLLEAELSTVMKESKRPVKIVWKDLLLVSDQPSDVIAPLAGKCAHEQGKFWEMHDALMSSDDLGFEAIAELARKQRLDMNKFQDCVESGRYLPELRQERQLAEQHGMTAAPTFFIGEQAFVGHRVAQDILEAIRRVPATGL